MKSHNIPYAVIVNDEPVQLSLLSILTRESGFFPLAFSNAEDALRHLTLHIQSSKAQVPSLPSFIITDLCMPVIDGWRFCRLLRSPEYLPFNKIPVIVVSATFGGSETHRIAADIGADAFLPSPVDREVFSRTVRQILQGERPRIQQKVLIVEDSQAQSMLMNEVFLSNGFETDTAYTLKSASEVISTRNYDLAVIDYHLPDGWGDTLLDLLQFQQGDCACLMVTADPSPDLSMNWMKRGAAAYLRKPFAPQYLLEVCSKILRERNLLRVEHLLQERTRQLQLSEERFRTLADHTADWEIWIGPDLKIIYISPSCLKITGYSQDEFMEEPDLLSRVILAQDMATYSDHEKDFAKSEDHKIEFRIQRKDGTQRWIEHVCHPVYRTDGKFLGRRVSNRDITDRKLAEEDLLVREKYFRDLFENAGDALFIEDTQDRIIDVNSKACKLLGYSREELIKLHVTDLQAPECRKRKGRVILDELSQGEGIPFETLDLRKDGSLVPVEVTTVRFGKNEDRHVLSIVRDISERKKAQEDQDRLIRAIEQSGEAIVITDLYGNIQYVNPTFTQVTGYSVQESIGANTRILKSGVHDHAFYRDLWETISGGETWKGVMVNRKKDGSLFTEEATISPVCNSQGSVVNYVAVKLDISDRIQVEHEKSLLEKQYIQAQKLETVGRLAGGVAHDFNNMLGVILGHVELLLDQVDQDHAFLASLNEIRKATVRSADLTKQLLAYASQQPVSPRALDVNEQISGMLKMLKRMIGEDIEIQWTPADDPLSVFIDPSQLDQTLANLCVNARDAIAGVGKIFISSGLCFDCADTCNNQPNCLPGEYVRLTVTDTGSGIDDDTLAKIFDPFFTTKELGRGTGLGLATVYGAIKQNNGFVNVVSEIGKGTTFKVCLPRYKGSAEQIASDHDLIFSAKGHETILLVEDDFAMREVTATLLRNLNYTVWTASSPSEGVEIAGRSKEEVHLLLTDVIMPEMNGLDLAEILKSIFPKIKILFASGYPTDEISHHGVIDVNTNFIQKPFSRKDLSAKVRHVLDSI